MRLLTSKGEKTFAEVMQDHPWVGTVIGILFLTLALEIVLVALSSVGYFSFAFIATWWRSLLEPAALSLSATVASYVVGFAIAIPLGLVRAFGPRAIRRGGARGTLMAPVYAAVTAYVEAVRGTPILIQIFLVAAWGTRALRGLPDVQFWAGVLALTVNTAGYQAEVLRAGFQSVAQGQIEAAKSIGMRPRQVFASITLPQSLRLITLPMANEWIALFKASALLNLIAVEELMYQASFLANTKSHPIEAFLMVSFAYLVIIIPLSKAVTYIERRRRIPGLGVAEPTAARRAPRPAGTG